MSQAEMSTLLKWAQNSYPLTKTVSSGSFQGDEKKKFLVYHTEELRHAPIGYIAMF